MHLVDGAAWPDWADPLSLLACYTSFAVDASGAVQDLPAHLARLAADSLALHGTALDDDVVRRVAAHHVAAVGGPLRLRVAVLARTPPLQPQQVDSLHVVTSDRPLTPAPSRPWSVVTVPHVRTLPQVKGVEPFVQLHAKREARLVGADDALYARGDDLLEGTSWALLAVTDRTLVVPAQDVLPSIGAARVQAAAGLPVERRPVRRDELGGLRLLLASTALHPATAVGAVDGRPVPVDDDLQQRLRTACAAVPGQPLG